MLNETWIIMLLMSGKCRNFALEFRRVTVTIVLIKGKKA